LFNITRIKYKAPITTESATHRILQNLCHLLRHFLFKVSIYLPYKIIWTN